MLHKLSCGLTRKPKLVLLVAVALLIPSFLGMAATRINYDILSYLPQDLDSAQGEKLLEEPFHMAATSMLVVEDMPAAYTNRLLEKIEEVPGVSRAIWLSNMVGIQVPVEMVPASMRDVFFAGDATMMIIQYEESGASDVTMDAIDQIRSICNQQCFLAGFSTVTRDTRALMDKEMPLYVVLAALLSLAAMSLTMDSWLLPVAFLLSIGMAIVYNFGTNIFLGEISYITKAIAAVLQLGVTMDYSIFLYKRYAEECTRHDDKRDAMAVAIEAAFVSLSGSSLTTIAGFLALCAMQLTLGRDIGIVMAKGVVLGVATVILVLPSMLLVFDKAIHKHRHKVPSLRFDRLNQWVCKHRGAMLVIFVLLFFPALYAQNHAPVYYKLDESLPRDLDCIVANDKLKTEFDMASSHFIVLDDDILGPELTRMENEIRELPGVNSLISYNALLGTGVPDFFVPEDLRSMVKCDGKQLMMVNTSYAAASDQVAQQLQQLTDVVKKYDAGALITGEAAMTDDLITTAAVDFRVTNYLSVAAIFVIVFLVFRSISVPIILVAAIELAIFINQGVPYFTGTPIPFISPTVISCVQLGATVDYAILMATRFREELQNGHDRFASIQIAAGASDPSIIASSLVLFCATMGVGFISKIEIISSICMMLARGALISAAVSLFLMPSLLLIFEPLIHKTSRHWRTPKPPRQKKAHHPATIAG